MTLLERLTVVKDAVAQLASATFPSVTSVNGRSGSVVLSKSDVGLGSVNNTSDANKPVSTAQAAAIAVVQADVNAHEARTDNPHTVTKTQVGLGNVDNVQQEPAQTAASQAEMQAGTESAIRSVSPLRVAQAIAALAPVGSGIDWETALWISRVIQNGGALSPSSVTIADALIKAIKAASFDLKIFYLMPLLGKNLAAAAVPLRDLFGGTAIPNPASFSESDFTQATGLQGNGSNKYLTLPLKPSQIGTGSNGGLGYWENNIDFTGTGVEPIGCYSSGSGTRFCFDFRTTPINAFRWGDPANSANLASTPTNGHFYGQRSSATSREAFKNGTSYATNTTNDAAAGAGDTAICLLGNVAGDATCWKGRCACAYLTTGDLTSGEVSALHTLLNTYLITPTGR